MNTTIAVDMGDIATALEAVRARITAARGGSSHAVTLVAVSKRKPVSAITEAVAANCRHFGENYVQELAEKAETLDKHDIAWHFIGHLQRNKVKALLACKPALIHGVDSIRLLQEIDKRAEVPTDVLVQVNVTGEDTKAGCTPGDVPVLVEAAQSLTHVRLRGLMTMPPAGSPDAARGCFAALRELADHIGRDVLPELSMGMSQDFAIAIEEGATIVRVGSAIFGARA